MLAEPRNAGQRAYFFGDLPLDPEWFRSRLATQLANLRDPYEHDLHAVTNADMRLHFLARDFIWRDSLRHTVDEAGQAFMAMRTEWNVASTVDGGESLRAEAAALLATSEAALKVLHAAATEPEPNMAGHRARIEEAKGWVSTARIAYSWKTVAAFKPELLAEERERPELSPLQRLVQPTHRAVQILQRLHQAEETLVDAERPAVHVLGGAGIGKTHGAAHVCHTAVSAGRPAVLLLGGQFRGAGTLEAQILQQLDVPHTYSWREFVGALDSYAASCQSPALLVIDALNEAEEPALWKRNLPGLLKSLSEYPRVRVVTTCRPSYVETVFGEAPADAVTASGFPPEILPQVLQRYFARYKLVVDLSLVPPGQFRHPLFLKIFCESENAGRAEPREVFLGTQTLFTVLDRYLDRAGRSICKELDRRPYSSFLVEALGPLADALWQARRRTIPFHEAERLLDGSPVPGWTRSLTHALLGEGLLISRDLAGAEGEQVGFTYDLLGGYLLARRLLAGQDRDSVAAFIESDAVARRLAAPETEERHPLHEDILRGLAAAMPSQTGVHLVAITRDPVLWNAGVGALFEMSPEGVTEDALDIIAATFAQPEARLRLLHLAWNTALSPRHPLNLRFWDRLLEGLGMRDRDLAWSVHVQRSMEFWNWLVGETERVCRIESPPETDERLELAAIGLRWLLACTVPVLRDRATRALYWYGRREPEALASMAMDSLAIDDPYVPQRCLAACFGVAMAYRASPASAAEEYRSRILPALARRLYSGMFAPGAPHASSHALLRDSASGVVHLAAQACPALFTPEELARATAPFPAGSGRADVATWGTAEDRDQDRYQDGNAPLTMDFANYTVGGLVAGRSLYEDGHPGYREVLGQLWWRMYDLGYRFDAFGELDVRTGTVAVAPPVAEQPPYVERFGQKYAWIAYFELYGWRADRGLLPDSPGGGSQRPPDVDLDASFPDPPHRLRVVAEDFLPEDRRLPPREWVERGPVPDVTPWLRLPEVDRERGPWVLLDGVLEHTDPVTGHGILVLVRSALALSQDVPGLARGLAGLSPERVGLPGLPQDTHTFAGEVPWRATFPRNESAPVSLAHSRAGSERAYHVLLPVRRSAWESHHSEINPGYGVALVAKQIAEELGLWMRLPSWDLHEPDGRRATVSVHYNAGEVRQVMTWIRQDVLDRWLAKHRSGLVWVVGGERRRSVRDPRFREDPDPGPHHSPFSVVYGYLQGQVNRIEPSEGR